MRLMMKCPELSGKAAVHPSERVDVQACRVAPDIVRVASICLPAMRGILAPSPHTALPPELAQVTPDEPPRPIPFDPQRPWGKERRRRC